MVRSISPRQTLRRSLIFIPFLLFPVILNYFSPYLIIDGAFQGVVSGSALTFGGLFIASLLFGRAFCGWACPAAGLQEAALFLRDRKVSQKGNWIKWAIWGVWVGVILLAFVTAGGIRQVNPLHRMDSFVSVTDPVNYIVYYFVVGLIFVLSLAVGSRAFCHSVCWMAPFMILGRKLRNLVGWPSLRLVAEPERCGDCKSCVRTCPMSLDVNGMVQASKMEHSECILCGNCVDGCSKDAIRYSFSAGGK